MADFKNNSSVSLNFLTFEPTKEKGFTSLFLDFFVKSVTFWHLTRTYICQRFRKKLYNFAYVNYLYFKI